MAKNKKIPEILQSTAIYAAWQRLTRCGFSIENSTNFHSLSDYITNLNRNKITSNTFYEYVDTCIADIIIKNDAIFDTSKKIDDSYNELYILKDSIIKCFKGLPPGFEPLGDKAIDSFNHFFQAHVNLTVAVITWLLADKHVYTISSNLSQMLLKTKLDKLECKYVKLPFSCIYITLPKDIWTTLPIQKDIKKIWNVTKEEINGVLISETIKENYRILNFLVLGFVEARTGKTIMGLDKHTRITLKNDETLENILETQLIDTDPFFSKIFKYITAIIVYITSIDADITLSKDSIEYLKWCKELKRFPPGHKQRKNIQLILDNTRNTNTKCLGRKIQINRHINNITKQKEKGTHASPIPHWRSGHFRSQPYGPKSEIKYKTIWIEPQIIGIKGEKIESSFNSYNADRNTGRIIRDVQ